MTPSGRPVPRALVIPFLAEGLLRALDTLPPSVRRSVTIAMPRRLAAGMSQLSAGSLDTDWRRWPAEGHRMSGYPVVMDDSLELPQIRYQPRLGPPLPRMPDPVSRPPTVREAAVSVSTAVRDLLAASSRVAAALRRRTAP